MASGPYTRIMVKRPNGRTEVIGRPGVIAPGDAAAMVKDGAMGTVVAVRHEHMQSGKRVMLAIHDLKGRG
jgi:hypothetical protein